MIPFSTSRLSRLMSLIAAGCVGLGAALGWLWAVSPADVAEAVGEVCFATHNHGGNVFASVDSQAVRDAAAVAGAGGVVKIAGTCAGVQVTGGLTQTVAVTQALTLAGGYTTTDWVNSYPITQPTTLDAQGGGRVISATAALTLTNLTVQNGRWTVDFEYGGGIYANQPVLLSGVTIYSNTVTGATARGGGIYSLEATTLSGVTIYSNSVSGSLGNGGGAYFNTSASVISSTFANNSAARDGGGAFFVTTPVDVFSATFSANTAGRDAGGAFFVRAPSVTNTVFLGNMAGRYGGGAFLQGVSNNLVTEQFINTLFAANSAPGTGAAIYALHFDGDDTLTLVHTTIASPTLGSGAAIYVVTGTAYLTNTIVASYTVGLQRNDGAVYENYNLFSGVTTPYVGGITSGGNSITGTAAFYDTAHYTLTLASRALNAGANAGLFTDFQGETRPLAGGFDIGWDEFEPPFTVYLPLIRR
jgi:predicted outer membrane repeat protein